MRRPDGSYRNSALVDTSYKVPGGGLVSNAPDAVQLLTLCSTGNNWMKIVNLGRYAVALFDKHTGEGVRVSVDLEKLKDWPQIRGWFMKLVPKKEQDTEELFREDATLVEVNPLFEEIAVKRGFYSRDLMALIAEHGSVHGIEAVPEQVQRVCDEGGERKEDSEGVGEVRDENHDSRERQFARGAGNARPRQHCLDPGLHASGFSALGQGLRQGASTGQTIGAGCGRRPKMAKFQTPIDVSSISLYDWRF